MSTEIRRGRTPKYCGATCRKRASRARQKSKPWDALLARSEGRWVRAVGKRPVTISGAPASSTDASTWSSFESVSTSAAGDGFGVMLGGGLGCYDLDNAIVDGSLTSWAREAIDAMPEPVLFVERSMSGSGLHVFVDAPETRGSRKGGVERYTKSRFIKCTFDVFPIEGVEL